MFQHRPPGGQEHALARWTRLTHGSIGQQLPLPPDRDSHIGTERDAPHKKRGQTEATREAQRKML